MCSGADPLPGSRGEQDRPRGTGRMLSLRER